MTDQLYYDKEQRVPTRGATLLEVIRAVLRRSLLISAAVAVTVTLAILYLLLATPKYEAAMVVKPTDDQALGSQLSSIAQVAGIGGLLGGRLFSNAPNSNLAVYINLLHSRGLSERLMAEHGLLRKLRPELWDEELNEWRRPSGPVFWVLAAVRSLAGSPTWTTPSGSTLAEYLQETLRIAELEEAGLYRITFRHPDPVLALDTLKLISSYADAAIKDQFLKRTAAEVAYLSERLNEVTVTEHRRAIAQILGEKERVLLMASIDAPFVVDIVDQPFVTDRPVVPSPALILALGLFSGLFVGVLAAIVASRREIQG